MIFNLSVPLKKSGTLTASMTPLDGVTYTEGITGLDPATLSLAAQAISNLTGVTNDTMTLYVDGGSLHRKISVNDQVTIPLNGADYGFHIIGFNHDDLTDPAAYGAITTTCKAGITLDMFELWSETYAANPTQSNVGGWKESALRTEVMPMLEGYMPQAWRSVIKPVNKVAGKGGGGADTNVETVSDRCFLLSEVEQLDHEMRAYTGEGTQYARFKAENKAATRVKKQNGTGIEWWMRSPVKGDDFTNAWCYINPRGYFGYNYADTAYGISCAFCV